jgi:hypothetical protein
MIGENYYIKYKLTCSGDERRKALAGRPKSEDKTTSDFGLPITFPQYTSL